MLGIWWSGISQGLIYAVPTVAELISRMVSEVGSALTGRKA